MLNSGVLHILKDIKENKFLLCCVYWFRIKVSLCIYWSLFLCFRGVAGIYVVWRNGSSNGTEARHWNFKNFSVKFLKPTTTTKLNVIPDHLFIFKYIVFQRPPCALVIQKSPRKVCGSNEVPPLRQLQSLPNRLEGNNISNNARSDWSKAAG